MAGFCLETNNNTTMTTVNVRLDNNAGTPFTLVADTRTLSQRQHCYLGYLLDSQVTVGTHALYVNVIVNAAGGTTITNIDAKVGTYQGVDQTSPIPAGSSAANNSGATNVTFNSAVNYFTGGTSVYITANGGTPATITNVAGFTTVQTTTANGQSSFIGTAANATSGTYLLTSQVQYAGTTSARSAIVVAALNPAPSTIIGDGTSPANKTVKGSATNNAVSTFTLATSTGTDTVTSLTVTGAGTGVGAVAANGVKIWQDNGTVANEWDAGDTPIGTATFTGTTATFAGLSVAVTTTAVQYLVTYDIIAAPTNGQTITASITGATKTNATNFLTNNDNTDATLTIDTASPNVTITQAGGQADPTGATPINFTATFNETVTGFTNADVVLSGTANATTVVVTGAGPAYNVAVSGMANSGTVIINIPAGAAQDTAGNLSNVSINTDNQVQYNAPAPVITIGDGTSPANKTVGPNAANAAVSAFTLVTNVGTQTLTGLTVTGTNTANAAASGVKIWRDNGTVANEWDAGDTQIATGSFAGNTAVFTGLSISVTNVSASYIITYTTNVTVTAGQTMTGVITAPTGSATVTNNDTADATLTMAAWNVFSSVGLGNGTITPVGNIGVANNGTPAFNSTPATGYILDGLVIDVGAPTEVNVGRFNNYTMLPVTANRTITANFDSGWLAPNANPSGNCTNRGNAYVSDNVYTTCGTGNTAVYTFPSFNIPAGSVVDGIEVAVEGQSSGRDLDVSFSDNGVNFYVIRTTGYPVSTADQTQILGSSTDTWGIPLLNANNFAAGALRMQISGSGGGGNFTLDQIQVKVHYREPSTLTVDAVTGTYGGTVNLTATLTKTVGGGAISGQTVTFYINGTSVGTATTNASGLATLSNVNLGTLTAGTYNGVYNTSGIGASYAGTVAGALPGYSATTGAATLTVNQAVLTITAVDLTKTYDGIPFAGGNGVTYSGFLPGDTVANSTTGTVTYSGTSQGAVNQGNYVITPGGVTSTNYSITFVNGALIINPAALTISAIDDSKT